MFRNLFKMLSSKGEEQEADPSGERRDKIRLGCRIRVQLGTSRGLQEALVVNVSSTGLCLEAGTRLKAKEKVKLHKREFGGGLEARVAWCRPSKANPRRYQFGVVFVSPENLLEGSWLVPALKKLGYRREHDGEKRRVARVEGRVGCFLHCYEHNMHFPGALIDLSLDGALVEGMWPLPMDEEVRFATDPLEGLAPLKGAGIVVNQICVEENPPKWHSGLRFTESSPGLTQKYVKALMAAR